MFRAQFSFSGELPLRKHARHLAHAAIIAALYAALTLGFQAISYGAVQFRVSEAMTLLPALFPEAIPGLAVGCLISNIFNPMGATVYDIVFGTLATLIAAILTNRMRGNAFVKALPPVICNAVIVGAVITIQQVPGELFWGTFAYNAVTVGLGEALSCYVLGGLLLTHLPKTRLFPA